MGLPLLTSARLLIQANFPTRLETILARVYHNPTLFSSPGITQLPIFSGNDPAGVHSLSRWTPALCISDFVFIPPRDFKHPGSSCLAGEVAFDLALIQASGDRHPQVLGQGLQEPWFLCWSQGPYHSKAISLPSFFQCSPTILASNLHICWDSIGCSICSLEDWLGVPPVLRRKGALLPSTSLPSSLLASDLKYCVLLALWW